MPTDDETFAQQRQMAVTRMQRPRAFSHTTYVDGAYGSFDPGEGGGSSAPAWVPENAKIHIDLVGGTPQGRAWVDGTGEVDVDTLIGADPDSDGFATTEYNPDDLMADGYVFSVNPPALIGAAESMILDEATFVIRLKEVAGPNLVDSTNIVLVSTDGNDALEYVLRSGGGSKNASLSSYGGALDLTIPAISNSGVIGAINVMAATITASRYDIAVNGATALAGAPLAADRPPGNPMAAVVLDTGYSLYTAIQSITIYDPLPSTAGLSELSEP